MQISSNGVVSTTAVGAGVMPVEGEIVLGLDLGTTYSSAAVVDSSGTPVILRNRQEAETTPSVVFFEVTGGKLVTTVGAAAKSVAAVRPDDVVQYVKRHMGDSSWIYDSPDGEEYTSEEVSAIILRSLVDDAEAKLGRQVKDVVITVPAYFDDARRVATKQAGEIAGLNVLRVINEPTAAALYYGVSAESDGYTLVYDLGGGTFDVTIIGIEGKDFQVLATDGDRNLGGFDWDNALMNYVIQELENEHGATGIYDDANALADIREKCEQAKRALTDVSETSIHVTYDSQHYTVGVSRAKFEDLTQGLLRRTQELVEDTLDESGLDWSDITNLLLVGGSTKMPMVKALMERLSGHRIDQRVDPDTAIALGAAIQGALETSFKTTEGLLEGVEIEDVTSIALGTIALTSDGQRLQNFVVIPKNTKVPAEGRQMLQTTQWLSQLSVEVTQGDDPDPDFATVLGEGILQLATLWPPDTPFVLVYSYDIDQTVTVEVFRLPDEEYVGAFEIDRTANLTDKQVATAMKRLKETEAASKPRVGPHVPASPVIPGITLPTRAQANSPRPSAGNH